MIKSFSNARVSWSINTLDENFREDMDKAVSIERRLATAIPERISYFIKVNKITPEEYLETKGQDYRNTPFLQVYGQEGKPCPKCGEMLCRIVVGGRGSVYCPVCQKSSEV